MPEIKLGSSKNARNINLGSKEIEEVRLGRILVWQNNIAPQIVLTTPDVGEYGDLNFPIGITVASNVNIIFSAQDLDPLDTIVSYAVDGPTGFTPIPTTPITPGNPVSGLTFTIPDTLFTNAGEPTTNNVFTVTVTDQRGKDGIYTVTVIGVSVPPPTISVRKEFGSASALTSNGPQSASAEWVITQPSETSSAGYIAQYSYDNVNWSNYNGYGIYRNTTAQCGGSSSVRVYCRSVKTGSTTANGNSATSTFSVSAPDARFPISLSGCTYTSAYVNLANGSYNLFVSSGRYCNGDIVSVGQSRTTSINLDAGNAFFETQGRIYGGTSFPTMSGGATINYTGRGRVRYSAPYTIPAVNGTTLNYSCSGGDYRIYATSNKYGGLQGLSQRDFLGVTRPGTLNDLGPDFIYTSFVTGTPIASVSITSAYGNISAQVSFTQIGSVSLWRSTYAGHWRTAEGGQVSRGGQSTRNFFTTKDPGQPPPPPPPPPPTPSYNLVTFIPLGINTAANIGSVKLSYTSNNNTSVSYGITYPITRCVDTTVTTYANGYYEFTPSGYMYGLNVTTGATCQ